MPARINDRGGQRGGVTVSGGSQLPDEVMFVAQGDGATTIRHEEVDNDPLSFADKANRFVADLDGALPDSTFQVFLGFHKEAAEAFLGAVGGC